MNSEPCVGRAGNGSLLLLLALGSCGARNPDYLLEFSGTTMGTSYSVKAVLPELPTRELQETWQRGVQARLDEIDALMSNWKEESDVSRLNRAEDQQVELSPHTLNVLRESREIWLASDGCFDPSLGPLIELWGFGTKSREAFPSTQEIATCLEHVNFGRVQIGQTSASKEDTALQLNLSSIAKGYGVDRAAEYLEEQGIRRYLVEVGGEMRVLGHNSEGKPWRVGIEAPAAAQERSLFTIVGLQQGAIASSGDYRLHFEREGRIYSHILDPRIGWPIPPRIAAASVLAPRCSTADAFATAFMVLDPQRSLELCAQQGMECLILERREHAEKGASDRLPRSADGRFLIHATPGFARLQQATKSSASP